MLSEMVVGMTLDQAYNITQARMRYGWEPTVSLRQGLERTIAYFDGLLRSGVLKGAA